MLLIFNSVCNSPALIVNSIALKDKSKFFIVTIFSAVAREMGIFQGFIVDLLDYCIECEFYFPAGPSRVKWVFLSFFYSDNFVRRRADCMQNGYFSRFYS